MLPVVQPTIPMAVVLVVDDSADDLLFALKASAKLVPLVKLITISNGGDAVAYVSGTGNFSDREQYPLPSLMILDLKMPGISGFDVLTMLSEAKTRKPPFICVMCSSDFEADINKAKTLGADDFYTKPSTLGGLIEVLQKITTKFAYTPELPLALAS